MEMKDRMTYSLERDIDQNFGKHGENQISETRATKH